MSNKDKIDKTDNKYNNLKDNTIKDIDGYTVDVYEDDIYRLADDYINTRLLNPDDILKRQPFAGMIKYISKNIPKPNMEDIVLLDKLWNIYTDLCYKYNAIITIERYCILININRDTFYSWYKGETRNDWCKELCLTRSDIVKKWDKESESSVQDEASTGNPGPMFILKARRGWSEQAPAVGASEQRMLTRTPEQIQADYIQKLEKKPDDIKPEF